MDVSELLQALKKLEEAGKGKDDVVVTLISGCDVSHIYESDGKIVLTDTDSVAEVRPFWPDPKKKL
jgi:hypothetical protein